MEKEIRKIKRTNYLIFTFFVVLFLTILIYGFVYQYKHTFTTDKWIRNPDERTMIVDDMLQEHDLVGMSVEDILTLLGPHNNDYGYFQQENRYVYHMGPERGLFSIDSEWLILDFSEGFVTDCFITCD